MVAKHRTVIYEDRDRILQSSTEYLLQRLEKDMYETMEEIIRVHWPLKNPPKLREFFPSLQMNNQETMQDIASQEEYTRKLKSLLFHPNWLCELPLFQQKSYAVILRFIYLQQVDHLWMEHLKRLDLIFQVIGLQVYRQADPFLEYQRQAYDRFQELVANIRRTVVYSVTHYEPNRVDKNDPNIYNA